MVPPPPMTAFLAAGHRTFPPKTLFPMVVQGSTQRISSGWSGGTRRPLRISMQDFSSSAYWNIGTKCIPREKMIAVNRQCRSGMLRATCLLRRSNDYSLLGVHLLLRILLLVGRRLQS
ncbi:unnamed protein product [Ectocarpus sp. 13 AM-2016]